MAETTLNPTPTKRKQYRDDIAAVITASDLIIPIWDGLSGAQKQAAQDTLANWGAATDAERITALVMLCALQQKALDAALTKLGLQD